MTEFTVKFLSFEGCPLAPGALRVLEKSVSQLALKHPINIRKVDLMHTDTPEQLKRWGSPTILVNGRDITGAAVGDANCCRIYNGPDGLPEQKDVVLALELAFGK